MGDYSSDSVSIDMETLSHGGKEHLVRTCWGSISVSVVGDTDKPALITYPDLALNHMSCFQGLFFCPEACSLLLHNFCIYHISPPGHEVCNLVPCLLLWVFVISLPLFLLYMLLILSLMLLFTPFLIWHFFQELFQLGASSVSSDDPVPSVDDLADQIAEVLNFFGLGAVMCMGVTAGAYILTLFAMKHRQRVLGLILISPLCKAPSWTEWLYNKVVSNLLYFYGTCSVVKELLLKRYFSKEVRGAAQVSESDVVRACRRLLDERQSPNVWRFLEAINGRPDITEGLRNLQCRSLIFVGEYSPFHSESLHMTSKLDRRYSALVEVQACGSMVTEEQPHAMLIPMEYFLMGYGLYRPSKLSVSPRSPLSPTFISPELLSPESMGLKLKPIKTRMSAHV